MVWLIFDLDRTLVNRQQVLYPGVREILQTLNSQGYSMFVISFNPAARRILQEQHILHLFQDIIVKTQAKAQSIYDLSEQYSLPVQRAIFFDDSAANLETCRYYQIQCQQVDPNLGIQARQIRTAIRTAMTRTIEMPT